MMFLKSTEQQTNPKVMEGILSLALEYEEAIKTETKIDYVNRVARVTEMHLAKVYEQGNTSSKELNRLLEDIEKQVKLERQGKETVAAGKLRAWMSSENQEGIKEDRRITLTHIYNLQEPQKKG